MKQVVTHTPLRQTLEHAQDHFLMISQCRSLTAAKYLTKVSHHAAWVLYRECAVWVPYTENVQSGSYTENVQSGSHIQRMCSLGPIQRMCSLGPIYRECAVWVPYTGNVQSGSHIQRMYATQSKIKNFKNETLCHLTEPLLNFSPRSLGPI